MLFYSQAQMLIFLIIIIFLINHQSQLKDEKTHRLASYQILERLLSCSLGD